MDVFEKGLQKLHRKIAWKEICYVRILISIYPPQNEKLSGRKLNNFENRNDENRRARACVM